MNLLLCFPRRSVRFLTVAARQQTAGLSTGAATSTAGVGSSTGDGSCGSAAAAAAAAAAASSSSSSSSSNGGVFRQSCRVAGRLWTFETGRLARLAHGSCLVTVGGTSVLSTAVVDPTPQPAADNGAQLQVEYRERLAAAGRLPTRPDRRERSGDREVLAARLVDRSLRPLLPPGFAYDTQVWCQVLSADGEVEPEVVAVNAASAALLLAPALPYCQPLGAVRARLRRGRLSLNPAVAGLSEAQLSLMFAGSPCKATAIEATANQVSDASFIKALRWAAQATQPLIEAQQALAAAVAAARSEAAGDAQQPQLLPLLLPSRQVHAVVEQLMQEPLRALFSGQEATQQQQQQEGDLPAAALLQSNKLDRAAALTALQRDLLHSLQHMGLLADEQAMPLSPAAAAAAGLVSRESALLAFDLLQSRVMRQVLLQQGRLIDGRASNELRPVSCQAGPLPRAVHGSGLISRGETQSLATATLGTDRDVSQVETLFQRTNSSSGASDCSRLHLHYAFPPFSVGEIGRAGQPNRREVGHGNLARSALLALMPSEEAFPFVVRLTADTLSSSGSSSMAAVCASSLALKAAGVPMQALAAGISIGLVSAAPPQLGPYFQQQQAQGEQGEQQVQGQQAASLADFCRSYSAHILKQGAALQAAADEQQSGSSSSSSDDEDAQAAGSSSSSSSDDDDGAAAAAAAAGVLDSSYGPALLLTDIQGIEDHHGDMDFKVAGTAKGITAVQLDTKLPGVDLALLEAALAPATAARHSLLRQMAAAVAEYERCLEPQQAPQHGSVELMKELLPRLIGPQGSTVMEIEAATGASLIIDDTGAITIYGPTQLAFSHAVAAVQEVEGRGLKAGQVLRVRVLRVVDFGAYVALPNGLPALLHISELSHSRIREAREVLREGDELEVLCKGRDAKGFVRLSLKDLLPRPDGSGGGQQQDGQQQQLAGDDQAAGGRDRDRDRDGGAHPGRVSRWRPRALTWQPPAAAAAAADDK